MNTPKIANKILNNKNRDNLLTPELKQKLRFAVVGVVNTITAYLAFMLLYQLSHHYIGASIISYFVGMLVSYVLNRSFVFKQPKKSGQFVPFCAVNLTSLACSTGILYLLVDHLGVYVYLAQIGAVCASMVINYLGYRTIFTRGVCQ